ncbi:MAG TPA: 3-deoxy-D-manno-octulosonic acid transferase [Rhodobacteraceae bacterium]|nr:3-deoxy-D-manno-octulosonic acid transferase [Paracoccaceae bacterium]
MKRYPARLIDRLALLLWDIAWHAGLPLVLLYLWHRGRKEPLYRQYMGERFGGGAAVPEGAIWIHGVSLGEMRAARPLVDALLKRGEQVLITNITAAGRAETLKLFADAIKRGQLHVRWCPAEYAWAIRRFLGKHKPRFGMIMEIELWPRLIATCHAKGLPLVQAQAQYPDKSFARDSKGLQLRSHVVRAFDLIMAKSERHAERFRRLGAQNVQVMGELRFEQPIPPAHLQAAADLRAQIAPERPVFCLASTAPDEDALLIPVLHNLLDAAAQAGKPRPFIVYVPRHPKDFAATGERLQEAGLNMLQRSTDLDDALSPKAPLPDDLDGLFGDSLGEINFYFALSDRVFMGDSFNGEGSHNIIEPLSLGKPVAVGPSIWGIEYPALEALKAGVLTKVETPKELIKHWSTVAGQPTGNRIKDFLCQHSGATKRAIRHMINAGLLNDTGRPDI